MERNPREGNELRRRNKSYVFFRETHLSANDEPIGAQGISLTPGVRSRSIASFTPTARRSSSPPTCRSRLERTPGSRLMIAQDTGGAIIGPARADLYFGAATRRQHRWRLRHDGRFVMLAPKELVPAADDEIPLPRRRPTIEEMAAYEKFAAKQKPKPKRRSPKPRASAGDHSPAQKPATKPARRRRRPSSSRLKKTVDDKKSAKKLKPCPNRRQIQRQAGRQAQEQARSSGKKTRRLSSDERVLWKGVTRSIAPLRKVSDTETDEDVPAPARARAEAARQIRAHARNANRAAEPATPPPLAALGRKTKKRIARGADAIDGRLDLHGMTQAEAHDALFGFLRAKQARGSKVVWSSPAKARGAATPAAAACSTAWCRSGWPAGIPQLIWLREARREPRRRRRAVCELRRLR
jgi:DNA-nicking Smr family endonuclease